MGQITIEQKKKEKQLKFEKKNFEKKKILTNILSLTFHFDEIFLSLTFFYPPLLFCWTFVGHFYPPLRNRQTEKQTHKQTNPQTHTHTHTHTDIK